MRIKGSQRVQEIPYFQLSRSYLWFVTERFSTRTLDVVEFVTLSGKVAIAFETPQNHPFEGILSRSKLGHGSSSLVRNLSELRIVLMPNPCLACFLLEIKPFFILDDCDPFESSWFLDRQILNLAFSHECSSRTSKRTHRTALI